MFIILDSVSIYKLRESNVIGFSPDCEIPLGVIENKFGDYATILKDSNDKCFLEAADLIPVWLNNDELQPQKSYPVNDGDIIYIEKHTLEILGEGSSDENKIITAQMDETVFENQVILHSHILDTLRKRNEYSTSEVVLRNKIHEELDIKLSLINPTEEQSSFLLTKALKKILLTRIERRNQPDSKQREEEFYSIYNEGHFQHAPAENYVNTIQEYIQLDMVEDVREKNERVRILLNWAISRNRNLDLEVRQVIINEYLKDELLETIFGLGPLQELIDSHDINDIMVLPSGKIYVDRNGQIEDTGKKMLNSELSFRIIERMVSKAGRRLDQTSPMVDAKGPNGIRVNAIIPPLADKGPALTIRKFADKSFTLNDLVDKSTLPKNVALFLEACVLAKKNIVVSGGTGSGKTTLLNALSSLVPKAERIIVIEDTSEIKLAQNHVIQLQSRAQNLEGKNAITIRQLVRNALRMRPDRIIIGECRGGEALDMLQAMNTGHEGSLTTIHANSPTDAVRRIEVMSLEAEGIELPSRAIRQQISSAINLVIQITRLANGNRKIESISEIVEFDDERNEIVIEEIYHLRETKIGKNLGRIKQLAFTGYIPTFYEKLLQTSKFRIEDFF